MISPEKRWQIAARISPEAEKNLKRYPTILQQILYNRGYPTQEAATNFLAGAELANTDPFELLGMAAAVERILHAMQAQKRMVVYGDYDTDGVSATALLVQALSKMGAVVDAYIPDRFTEGYGLKPQALENLKSDGAELVITVDCGIRAVEEADFARSLGLDLIITDHHTPGAEIPQATALINPKQPGDSYPNKNLAGVGVAYKLACALIDRLQPKNINSTHLLDLVALGTVADLVPLVGENRSLVREGVLQISKTQRQGLMALIGVSDLKPEQINASAIGFVLGPRLNAAGRVASARTAYELLLAEDVFEAAQLAQELDNYNRERQKITQAVMEQSELQVFSEESEPLLLFASDEDFNPGVVGLAASRLVDGYYRPAIVANRGKDFTRASCRSIAEFHITEALDQCADLLDHFGGHAAAAGFTVQNSNLPELIERLGALAEEKLRGLDLRPVLNAEVEVALLDLKPDLLDQLSWLQPTGYGNPEPLFVTRDLKVTSSRAVGRDKAHLKLAVTDGWVTFDAIAFRLGYLLDNLSSQVDLIYAFELNEFRGAKKLQLNVRDIKPSE
ncbi:MAG: single-stranded-DNA-specific exonuclease RecJ [Chloroflexi bacterium]|nr:single-stranded-DNA-specific exonuclease RecJ [Chloroflexota bacterium]